MFTGDRLCSYAVAFTEVANLRDAPERICFVELLYIDSETSEVISVARENASVLLLVNGKYILLFSILSPCLFPAKCIELF